MAIIGAGPVGLAAAAHLDRCDIKFRILEAGPAAGWSIRQWGHVRVFSPWKSNVDAAARSLLEQLEWIAPAGDGLPTGRELVEAYLGPLSRHPRIAPFLRTGAKVVRACRLAGSDGFRLDLGSGESLAASAIVDASGTWTNPRFIGRDGRPVAGERRYRARLRYGIPDATGAERHRYVGKRTLVLGSGHSAMNAVRALSALAVESGCGTIVWSMRAHARRVSGTGPDPLPARAALERAASALLDQGAVTLLDAFDVLALQRLGDGWRVDGSGRHGPVSLEVDEIVVAAGLQPDLDMFDGLELGIDSELLCVAGLAPLLRSLPGLRGKIPAHGWPELAHPQPDLFIIGIKSFGWAPSFDLETGYAQAAAVAAFLASRRLAAESRPLPLCRAAGGSGD